MRCNLQQVRALDLVRHSVQHHINDSLRLVQLGIHELAHALFRRFFCLGKDVHIIVNDPPRRYRADARCLCCGLNTPGVRIRDQAGRALCNARPVTLRHAITSGVKIALARRLRTLASSLAALRC